MCAKWHTSLCGIAQPEVDPKEGHLRKRLDLLAFEKFCIPAHRLLYKEAEPKTLERSKCS